jgi:hypothetical protein
MSAFGALQAPATKKFFHFSNFREPRNHPNWQFSWLEIREIRAAPEIPSLSAGT